MSFYTTDELGSLGLARFGENVRISRKASIYNPERVSIGNHVRIDDYCVISAGDGGIEIGNFVHIAVFCSLIGRGKIILSDFSGLSSRVSIYSSNEDYSGDFLTNPSVPFQYTNVTHAEVFLGKHVIIGAGTVVLPGVSLENGVAVGALSLVSKNCLAFGVYSGVPVRRIRERSRGILKLEENLRKTGNTE